MTVRRGRIRKHLLDGLRKKKVLEIESGSTRSQCVGSRLGRSRERDARQTAK